MKLVVDEQTARKEIGNWLDFKKVKPNKREASQDSIDSLVDAMKYGQLKIDSKTHVITHTLDFPLQNDQGEETVKSLEYRPRLTVQDQLSKLKGVKADDADGRVVAIIAAAANRPAAIIKRLDMQDYSIAQSVAVFFL